MPLGAGVLILNGLLSTLVLGNIWTLDPRLPEVDAVLLADGKVVALGSAAREFPATQTIILGPNETAIPAFVDHHLHLLSAAAAASSVDCSGKPTLQAVLATIHSMACLRPEQSWIRAVGYDDALLAEQRHPTRSELDEAGGGRPVVLHHATGHAAVLSSAALQVVCPELRAAGLVEDGLLIDRHDLLARIPRLPESDLNAGFVKLTEKLLQAGVVAVTDATHTNDLATLQLLDRLLRQTDSSMQVRALLGWEHLHQLQHNRHVGQIEVIGGKIMPVGNGLVLSGDGNQKTLAQAVAAVHALGFAAAIHVMDYDILEETLAALEASPPPEGMLDRIEHCALAMPEQLDRLARLPVEVVTQPSFLKHRAVKYSRRLSPAEHDWLYPVASLLQRGIPVRFSSDAPVVPSLPLEWVAAAMDRELAPAEAIDLPTALRLSSLGPLQVGGDGRLVVLSADKQMISRLWLN